MVVSIDFPCSKKYINWSNKQNTVKQTNKQNSLNSSNKKFCVGKFSGGLILKFL